LPRISAGENPPTELQLSAFVGDDGSICRKLLWRRPFGKIGFTRIARHRRVTRCLGSLGGNEWLIGVAPPGELGDDARPRVEDIAAFRVPGDRLIKLHVATWHAGPHFVHDECLFVNLENLDTNRRDFHAVPLSVECRYRL
jgi:ureidoglycolate lyase